MIEIGSFDLGVGMGYPSEEGRLFRIGRIREGWILISVAVMRSVHKFDYGHEFGRAVASPVMA